MIPGLTQDELASISSISKIEPVRNCRVTVDHVRNVSAGGASIHATDNDVGFFNFVGRRHVLLDGFPLESPEQVDSRREHHRLD
jgi:hypothetical protein